jgi:hypothetical protein
LIAVTDFSPQCILASLGDCESEIAFSSSVTLADCRVTVECDDQSIFPEFFEVFGGSEPVCGRSSSPAHLRLDIRAKIDPNFGCFYMSGSDDLPVDAREFSFGIQHENGAFERFPVDEDGWTCVAFRGSPVPAFAFRDDVCLFALEPRWRRSIMWYLFWRMLRIRSDAIFFHAAAVGINGHGTVFVAPAGGGKSTTSLALAARGHMFLSDEVAGYVPERGELIPFRRPVGIKPGPRARAVERLITPFLADRILRNGFARVGIETLFPVEAPRAIPLHRIVFLRGFAERPSLKRITPSRAEIVELQPLMSSFLNAPHSRRVFELARLLSSSKVYQLHPGDPDDTAIYLEQEFARE